MPITTLESLYQHLQWAIELEHFTIPPYLCALYSIPDGKNAESAAVIRSVVMEEMLHLTLAANVLNAVGGRPSFSHRSFVPVYPEPMPHSRRSFTVGLEKFSRDAVCTFMKIEKPEQIGSPPEDDDYETIGQFYDAVAEALVRLDAQHGIFTGDETQQVTRAQYYGGGGEAFAVYDLDSALKAIEEIKEQGEGMEVKEGEKIVRSVDDPDHKLFGQNEEVAHYYRFQEIYKEKLYAPGNTPKTGPTGPHFPVDWDAVYPMRPNPKASDYPEGSELRARMNAFNAAYTGLLDLLQESFDGRPERLEDAVGVMYDLKYRAVALMQIPSGHGDTTAGPSFEYYRPGM